MKNTTGLFILLLFLSFFSLSQQKAFAGNANMEDPYISILSSHQDTLPPAIEEREGDFVTDPITNPFDLEDPPAIKKEVEYDSGLDMYIIREEIGGGYFKAPTYMTFDEYMKWTAEKQKNDYFNEISRTTGAASKDPIDQFDIKSDLVDRLFGGTTVDIRPQGNIDLTFGGDYQKVDNPILTERQRRQGGFDFDMNIQMNVIGKIGDKLNLSTNYSTQTTFNFENQMKLEYQGFEDEIIQSIEAGNVSLPLRSSLIQGSQSLFGIKTKLQFGRLTATTVLSQQKSKREEMSIQGGTQLQTFEVTADNYDENRHFFLSHYNRDVYEKTLENLPQINTLFRITKMEVYVTNTRNATEGGIRDIVAFSDMGEAEASNISNDNPNFQGSITGPKDVRGYKLPLNDVNNLYPTLLANDQVRLLDNTVSSLSSGAFSLQQVRDYEKVRARKLSTSEFSYHPELGFISLNISLQPEDILAVAFEYTYDGETYQVGEFAQETPNDPDNLSVLYLKLLKSTTARVDQPIWDLMMKNIYSIGAYQVSSQDFKLDVFYQDPGGGEKRFIPEGDIAGRPLISLLNLDNLNPSGDPQPDGVFDFVPGVTINPGNGRVIFPVLEPFGTSLDDQIPEADLSRKYPYHQLYDSTIFRAREYPEFNRFIIRGSYRSSVSSEISLGAFNIPPGSVQVSAGGQRLVEGKDFDVDYNIGRIKILNESILQSGVPIKVSYEDNTLYGFQTKTMIGTRLDYWISDNFTLGATFLRLSERPFTQKVNVGDDPINNSIYGFDMQYNAEMPWLTKVLDRLPLYSTKEISTLSFNGEVAYLDPGHSKAISQEKEGVVYIDDFEGSTSNYDLRTPSNAWVMASVPNDPQFPEYDSVANLTYGVNRARLNWYRIDNTLRRDGSGNNDPYLRRVLEQEIFPNRTNQTVLNAETRTFDLAYYPDERGPYNFESSELGIPGISRGLSPNGKLNDPETRWGGIMRSLETNDFEAANIEFVEFWMLSPFINGEGSDGDLYLNLGNVSEDILRDSRKIFENGLPKPGSNTEVDTTVWGLIPRTQAITNAFDNDGRDAQDVGLDGLDNVGEQTHFSKYLNDVQNVVIPSKYSEIAADPANDDYTYYNSQDWPDGTNIYDRYTYFNNPHGNSQAPESGTLSAATNIPDSEDINRDNTLSETESFFQYRIPIRRDNRPGREHEMLDNQYVVNKVETIQGQIWYQMKIPIDEYTSKQGGIQDFRSIRFVRMYMNGFEDKTVMRLARFELTRNQWRRYKRNLTSSGIFPISEDISSTTFDVNDVNVEENSSREPFRYTLPPGILREQSLGPYPDALQNEQSLSMSVCDLKDGDARGVFKILNLDMRTFDRLRMFVHAEAKPAEDEIEKGAMTVFMRLGSDFENNYYEYEIPLEMTPIADATITDEEAYGYAIWRENNEFDFPLELLRNVKIARNALQTALNIPFEMADPDRPANLVKVVGNPDLGLVKGVMIGVRNKVDNGVPQCMELWANELRVSGFAEQGGFAGLARMDVQLADLGNLTLSGSYASIGWGSLSQKLAQRSKEEVLQYDVATTIELSKFLPKKWNIKLPFYYQYSSTIKTPQFDPYQLDIPLREQLRKQADRDVRDSLRTQAQDFTSIQSFNFTNVRKEKGENASKIPFPWDISNFSATYAFSRTTKHDPIVFSNIGDTYRGVLDYNYAMKPLDIRPFKKVKSKYLKFIKEINFNPIPGSLSMSNSLNRQFNETIYRFSDPQNNTWYNKRFTWDRTYGMQWALTKSIQVGFNANNSAIIDEPDGRIDTEAKKEELYTNLKGFGRNKNYSHSMNASYTLPFKYIPFMEWVQVKAQYSSTYNWTAASLNTDSLGNVIMNSQRRQLTGDFNFVNLYNKSKYLKKVNSKKRKSKGAKGKDKNKDKGKGKGDADDKGKEKKKKKKKRNPEPTAGARAILRPLMMVRKVRLSYSEDFSSSVPGFMPRTLMMGMNDAFAENGVNVEAFTAPGWDYITGWRMPDKNWLNGAGSKDWMTYNRFINQQVMSNYGQNMDAKLTIEPFTSFRIDLTANKTFTQNYSEYYKVRDQPGQLEHLTPMDLGSISLSYYNLSTLFEGNNSEDMSVTFDRFQENRKIISDRLAAMNGTPTVEHGEDGAEYNEGYGRYQQDVLIMSFLSAYTKTDANNVNLNSFKTGANGVFDLGTGLKNMLPRPNWRFSYNGLSKLEMFKKLFSNVSISHSYKSTLTMNQFRTDLDFDNDAPWRVDPLTANYYSEYEIPDLVISEQLSPLIGIDIKTKNDITAKFDFKKTRNLALGFSDYQLSESKTTEYTIGVGYRTKGLSLPFKIGKLDRLENDLTFKFDFSFRDDKTINHILDQGVQTATRGMKTIRISPSIDYSINKQLNIRIFFDRSRTVPATSASFPITNTQAGVTIRFSLTQ